MGPELILTPALAFHNVKRTNPFFPSINDLNIFNSSLVRTRGYSEEETNDNHV